VHCLQSLINQTHTIPIHLSISFETELDNRLFDEMVREHKLTDNDLLVIRIREEKTSQFRHIEKTVNDIKDKYNYVMFCDDDDTYENNRVEIFMVSINMAIDMCPEDKVFAGLYESDVSHIDKRQEYWSYCVKMEIIIQFMNTLKGNDGDTYLDNTMCDVLFASYLRHLDSNNMFSRIPLKMYNYNQHKLSITGQIRTRQQTNERHIPENTTNFTEFVKGLNDTLEQWMENEHIKNNIFLACVINKHISFDFILEKYVLHEHYKYKDKINKTILQELEDQYDNINKLCNTLYQL